MEEVTEDVDKRDYGVVVHAILRQFHAAVPVVAALGVDAARAELTTISQAEFAPLVRKDYAARAWQLRWEAVIPGYIEWQMSREAAGWRVRVEDCEQAVTSALAVPAHGEIALFGTPDRVDEALEGEVPRRAVLDYKTSGRDRLKGLERRPDEDGQLVLYAHLFSDVGELAYVPLEGGRDNRAVQPVALAGDVLVAVVDQHIDRLQQTLSRIGNGEALVAMGDEAACRYCQARGLCRRDHRATFTPQPASAA
jgi:ATP-dependent helicase/nuclease subunit B